jgi:hypothetical protein
MNRMKSKLQLVLGIILMAFCGSTIGNKIGYVGMEQATLRVSLSGWYFSGSCRPHRCANASLIWRPSLRPLNSKSGHIFLPDFIGSKGLDFQSSR